MRVQAYLPAAQPLQCGQEDGSTANELRGIAVPWDAEGFTNVGAVRFTRGALPTDATPPLVLHHDTHRPIGVVAALTDTDAALEFTARVSDTADGRETLILARDGALTGVSVGADVIEHHDDGGTLVITAAEWAELSLVTQPAFTQARLAAARAETAPDRKDSTPMDITPDETPQPDPPRTVAATLHTREREQPPGTVADLARLFAQRRAEMGVRAALADVTTTEWVSSPTYTDELDDWISTGTPVTDAFLTRTVASDATIYQRRWKTRPIPDKQSAEKTEIATNAAALEYVQVDPLTYAWGVDVSVQALDRGGESVITDVTRAATEEVAALIEADTAAALLAGATAGPATVTLDDIGTAIGALGKYNADVLIAAPDVYGALWADLATGGPGITRIDGGWPMPTLIKSIDMPAGRAVLGDRRAFRTTWSGTSQLRAVEVSLLGVNLGVYRYAVQEVRYAAGLIAMGPVALRTQSAPSGGKK